MHSIQASSVQILESDAELFFHLQQQQMIELIREGRIVDALLFAQEYLAYKGEENPSILDELGTQASVIHLLTTVMILN